MGSPTTSDLAPASSTDSPTAIVPVQTRSERFSSGDPADFPAVTGREPEWKLSPVEALRPLIDGALDGGAYPIEQAPGATARFVPAAEATRGLAGLAEDKAAANAWASTSEVLLVEITEEPQAPITLTRDDLGATARAAHTIIRVASNVHATLIHQSHGDALLAENVEFDLEPGSSLTAVFVAEWERGAIHYANHFAALAKDAHLTHIAVSLGGSVVTLNPSIQLVGQGSRADVLGAYFADSTQHIEHRVYVHHQGPKTTSRVSYKGALHGRGARTVWIGDVLIGADAVGTDSYEQNRNLVLSEGTRADSIPNLEIKTGDIEGAGHASATGRFDDEQLFYLRSRGIAEVDARRLVVMGFLGDVVGKIPEPGLVERLTGAIQNKLDHTEDAA